MNYNEAAFFARLEQEMASHQIPVYSAENVLRRQIARDMLPCADAKESLAQLGFVGVPDEQFEEEHVASHQRLMRILPAMGPAAALAGFAGEIIFGARLIESGIELTEEEHALATASHQMMIRAGTIGVISALVDLGIIKIAGEEIHGFLG